MIRRMFLGLLAALPFTKGVKGDPMFTISRVQRTPLDGVRRLYELVSYKGVDAVLLHHVGGRRFILDIGQPPNPIIYMGYDELSTRMEAIIKRRIIAHFRKEVDAGRIVKSDTVGHLSPHMSKASA